jgi:hypothetical protein
VITPVRCEIFCPDFLLLVYQFFAEPCRLMITRIRVTVQKQAPWEIAPITPEA